jgi:hypothetical protein
VLSGITDLGLVMHHLKTNHTMGQAKCETGAEDCLL